MVAARLARAQNGHARAQDWHARLYVLANYLTFLLAQVLGNIFGTKNTSEVETKATLDRLSQITQVCMPSHALRRCLQPAHWAHATGARQRRRHGGRGRREEAD